MNRDKKSKTEKGRMNRYINLLLKFFIIGFIFMFIFELILVYMVYKDISISLIQLDSVLSNTFFIVIIKFCGVMFGFINGNNGKRNYEEFFEELGKVMAKWKRKL